jgi:transglutaminase-like putative cysteine protease
VLAPLGCLAAALALDAAAGEPPSWYAMAVVAAMGLTIAALRGRPAVRGSDRWRRAVPVFGAVAAVSAAALLAALLAPSLPGVRGRPADVRALVAAPLTTRAGVSPLQQFAALHDDTLRVRLSGTSSPRVRLLRMVTLDRFDGRYWTTQARYRRAGRTLAVGATDGAVRVSVDAAEAPLPWLPQPGRPFSLDATGLGVDEATGDLAVPAGRHFPASYRVAGRPPPTADLPAVADDVPQPRTGPVGMPDQDVPADITAFARRALSARTGYARLAVLARQLRGSDFYVDDRASAPGGHGFFQISALLAGSAGIHAGTSEQYASAFAVMARVLGFDARVVLGFRPRYPSGSGFVISGSDVYAWADVRFASAGWVSFDPTPTALASLSQKTPPPPSSAPPPVPGSAAPAPSTGPSGPRGSGRADGAGTAGSASNSAWTVWALGALGALAVLLVAPPTLKAGRRRRRRARSPARAVYGAWQETLDRITEAGVRVRGGMSGGEVTSLAPPAARPYVATLAELLDRAGYAPEPAAPGAPRLAWANAVAGAAALRRGMSRRHRVRAWWDPRPLWRR